MTRLDDARAQLAAGLRSTSSAPERVHDVTPNRVDAPCVFIGGTSLDRVTVGKPGTDMSIATFPVYCVADGRPDEQTRTLDRLIAEVWDAAYRCGGRPIDATPTPIDVGGPTLRGAIVRVELTIAAVSLCTPTMTGATNG